MTRFDRQNKVQVGSICKIIASGSQLKSVAIPSSYSGETIKVIGKGNYKQAYGYLKICQYWSIPGLEIPEDFLEVIGYESFV